MAIQTLAFISFLLIPSAVAECRGDQCGAPQDASSLLQARVVNRHDPDLLEDVSEYGLAEEMNKDLEEESFSDLEDEEWDSFNMQEEDEEEENTNPIVKSCVPPEPSLGQVQEQDSVNYSIANNDGYGLATRIVDPDESSGFRYLACYLNAAPYDLHDFIGKKSLEECRHAAVMKKYTRFGVSEGKCMPLPGFPWQGIAVDAKGNSQDAKCGPVDAKGYSHGTPGHLSVYATDACVWRQTGGCDPNGGLEPWHNAGCDVEISVQASGFCDCNGNAKLDDGEKGYNCNKGPGTCRQACNGEVPTPAPKPGANEPVLKGKCCAQRCSSTADCAPKLFCCPHSHQCMDTTTGGTMGWNCKACGGHGPPPTGKEFQNIGIDCFHQCGEKGGKCDFCGKQGACCQKGFGSDPSICKGTPCPAGLKNPAFCGMRHLCVEPAHPPPPPACPPRPKGTGCCSAGCNDNSDCAQGLFCCPYHHECMDEFTRSTGGSQCDFCKARHDPIAIPRMPTCRRRQRPFYKKCDADTKVPKSGKTKGLLAQFWKVGKGLKEIPIWPTHKPDYERIDAYIGYGDNRKSWWGGKKGEDYFIVRWSGYLEIKKAGEYLFVIDADDTARLSIDREEWTLQSGGKTCGKRTLTSGAHPLKIEMMEVQGWQMMLFFYSGPDSIDAKLKTWVQDFPGSVVPHDALFTILGDTPTPPPAPVPPNQPTLPPPAPTPPPTLAPPTHAPATPAPAAPETPAPFTIAPTTPEPIFTVPPTTTTPAPTPAPTTTTPAPTPAPTTTTQAPTYEIKVKGGVDRDKHYLSARADGSKIELAASDVNGRQRWSFVKGSSRWYYIKVSGGVSGDRRYLSQAQNGKKAELVTRDDGSGRQRWVIDKLSDGSYHIWIRRGVCCGRRFLSTNSAASKVDGWWHDDGSGKQRWYIPGAKLDR